jgi:hypothetical protein
MSFIEFAKLARSGRLGPSARASSLKRSTCHSSFLNCPKGLAVDNWYLR